MEAGTQFIGIKPDINMQERKSNVANNPTDVFTIEEIANVSRPYKVFTALLTQSGGDDPQTITSGAVAQGITYLVIDNDTPGSNWDFSNVGGPKYPNTGYFVATNSETPISYFGSMVTYNTGAPVAKVLENTIGNVCFTYVDVGQYLVLSNSFPLDATGCFIGGTAIQSNCPSFIANTVPDTHPDAGKGVYIQCSAVDFAPDYYTDDALSNTMLEIRVYPSQSDQ